MPGKNPNFGNSYDPESKIQKVKEIKKINRFKNSINIPIIPKISKRYQNRVRHFE